VSGRYCCGTEERRLALRAQADPPALNGIDYLEVRTDPDPLAAVVLEVTFIHPLKGGGESPEVGSALAREQVLVRGGVRFRDPVVDTITATGRRLDVTMAPGQLYDFSTYRLILARQPSEPAAGPPDGFDPELAAVDLSFKAECPSDLDCRDAAPCPPPVWQSPPLDYLAKDYESFRRLMLDRLSALMPGWRTRSPADQQIMLVELLAHAADRLSWFQDAVATEAYLGTARLRTSLRRHARMLDYPVHDGLSARTFVHLAYLPPNLAADGTTLPPRTPVLTRGGSGEPRLALEKLPGTLGEAPTVFETMHALRLWQAHNRILLYTWDGRRCFLPRGAQRATLLDETLDESGQTVATRVLRLARGDLLLLEEVLGATTGLEADADPAHRHVVRLTEATLAEDPLHGRKLLEVTWAAADALPFPLCLDAVVGAPPRPVVTAVARGNIALADHGLTLPIRVPGVGGAEALYEVPELLPPMAPVEGRYRPQLSVAGIARVTPYRASAPATALLAQDAAEATAAVRLEAAEGAFTTRRDLLASGRFARDMVVEGEADGSARLRFGDGVHGARPPAGAAMALELRTGGGLAGNVGAGALARVATGLEGIVAVRNPLPATGGADPEAPQQIRAFAPEAFRVPERAVTLDDYRAMAERHPEVQHARARLHWTGGWHTVFLHLDRAGGRPVETDPAFLEDLLLHMERYRLMGHDLEPRGPVHVALDLALFVCASPGALRAEVRKGLLAALGTGVLPDGRQAFFHPDQWTFGQPLEVSLLVAAAMAVPGVASAEVRRLQRYGRLPAGEREAGRLAADELEILRCDSDPSFPENGRVEIEIGGGH
jgi:hypothetical protein